MKYRFLRSSLAPRTVPNWKALSKKQKEKRIKNKKIIAHYSEMMNILKGGERNMKQIRQALYTAFSVALATAPALVGAQGWNFGYMNASGSALPGGTIYGIINQTMNWLLAILGFIGIIGFVIAGILYLTAAGDEDQTSRAKNAMLYSIIGIVVALMGFVIIQAVDTWLTGSSITF